MIHELPGGFVISSQHVWLPGVYDTARTARWAFQFPDRVLAGLAERVNAGEGRAITREDLRGARQVDPDSPVER